jgi:hypothetical protein
MSWSLSFTGKDSIIKDACHRILIVIKMSDFDYLDIINQYQVLSTSYFLHLSIIFEGNDILADKSLFMRRLQRLQALKNECQGDDANKQKMFFSLQIEEPNIESVKLLTSLEFQFDLWIINAHHGKESLLKNLTMVNDYFTSEQRTDENWCSTVPLGMGNLAEQDDLDWLLLMVPSGVIVIVLLTSGIYPDLNLRSVDLVHSFGCNSIIILNDSQLRDIAGCQQLSALANKYNISPETFLLKCLLQCGSLIALRLDAHSDRPAYLMSHVARLCHPFVHRKMYVSATHVLSLQIEVSDLEVVTAASEEQEERSDCDWLSHSSARSDVRVLTFR